MKMYFLFGLYKLLAFVIIILGIIHDAATFSSMMQSGFVNLSKANFNIFLFFSLATGSAEIMPPYTGTLDSAYTALKANPDWLVEIQGHTDSDGSTKFNQGLSEKRAESVKSFLTGKGIDPARISTKGFGESKPIASNKTKAGKAKNRRIEFVRTK